MHSLNGFLCTCFSKTAMHVLNGPQQARSVCQAGNLQACFRHLAVAWGVAESRIEQICLATITYTHHFPSLLPPPVIHGQNSFRDDDAGLFCLECTRRECTAC